MMFRFKFKILIILFSIIFLLSNFYGFFYCLSEDADLIRSLNNRGQPDKSFKQYEWGGLGSQEGERYGWNITYISDFNGDANPDLIIGTPWYDDTSIADVGMVYIFYGKPGSGFTDLNYSKADVTIRGDSTGNQFGWDVADAGEQCLRRIS